MKCTRKGFTLVEILVVVAIIAILAAMLFPVFGRAREAARQTNCQNNLRQLGMAFAQYVQDVHRYPGSGQKQKWANGGQWVTGGEAGTPTNYLSPPEVDPDVPGLALSSAPFTYQAPKEAYPEKGVLYPYVKSSAVYVCPSNADNGKKKLSYSMNCALAFLGETRVTDATATILLVDEAETLNDGFFWAANVDASTDMLTQKHNGGGNLLFADGHVKHVPFAAFPLDNTTKGKENKGALTGPMRFHSPQFGGKFGSSTRIGVPTDSCFQSVS